jgi:hypothetical protein
MLMPIDPAAQTDFRGGGEAEHRGGPLGQGGLVWPGPLTA